jgi:hypothetical protein
LGLGTGDLLNPQLPLHLQVLTPGVFHPNRCAVTPPVFYLNDNATLQALVTQVFHLNQPAIERGAAARVFDRSRNDFAPMFFHFHHQASGQDLAHVQIFSKRKSG